ncbi:MAG: hypothetical protein K2K03_08840 [Prevotella sp.]|nr:hypothetical protein [Prevotella sp.]
MWLADMIDEIITPMAYIEYGILAAVILASVLLLLFTVLDSRKQLNAVSYVIALLLVFPLTFQTSRLIAVYYLSNTISTINLVGVLNKDMFLAINHEVGWYIVRRVLWSVLFMAIGGIGIWVTMTPKRKKCHAIYDDYDSNVSSTDEWGL